MSAENKTFLFTKEQSFPSCYICCSNKVNFFGEVRQGKNDLNMYKCQDCGLVFAFPQPEKVYLKNFYQPGLKRWSEEKSYNEERNPYFEFYIALIKRFVSFWDNALILDIGCGIGSFGLYLRQSGVGKNLTGIDISSVDCDKARSIFDKVICGDICASEITHYFEAQKFNLITMFDVLEHLYDPKTAMENIARLSMPSGFLLIDTGDVGGFGARLARAKTPFLQDEGHIFGYSYKSMECLLKSNGFNIISSHNESEIKIEKIPLIDKIKRLLSSSPNMILVAQKI